MEDDAMIPLASVSEEDVPDQRSPVPGRPAYVRILDGSDPFGRWRGQTVAIKYGGSAIEHTDLRPPSLATPIPSSSEPRRPRDGARGPAEYMRPCALDVSHLRAGVEPPAEMAGRVVIAGGRMRCEEGSA
jgi:hypothetical protein